MGRTDEQDIIKILRKPDDDRPGFELALVRNRRGARVFSPEIVNRMIYRDTFTRKLRHGLAVGLRAADVAYLLDHADEIMGLMIKYDPKRRPPRDVQAAAAGDQP